MSPIVKCGGILLSGKYGKSARRRTCLGFTLSTRNPRWNVLESDPGILADEAAIWITWCLCGMYCRTQNIHVLAVLPVWCFISAVHDCGVACGRGGACFVICIKHDPWGTLGTVSSHHIPTLLVLLQTQFLLFLKNVFPAEDICFRLKYARNKHSAWIPWNSCKRGHHKQAIKSGFPQYNLVQRKVEILRCLDKAAAAWN